MKSLRKEKTKMQTEFDVVKPNLARSFCIEEVYDVCILVVGAYIIFGEYISINCVF